MSPLNRTALNNDYIICFSWFSSRDQGSGLRIDWNRNKYLVKMVQSALMLAISMLLVLEDSLFYSSDLLHYSFYSLSKLVGIRADPIKVCSCATEAKSSIPGHGKSISMYVYLSICQESRPKVTLENLLVLYSPNVPAVLRAPVLNARISAPAFRNLWISLRRSCDAFIKEDWFSKASLFPKRGKIPLSTSPSVFFEKQTHS